MQTAAHISVDLIDECICEVTPNVISTMLNWNSPMAVSRFETEDTQTFSIDEVNGSVGFVGKITGSIFLSMSGEQASAMAEAMLQGPVDCDSDEVSDVVGELTNIVAGGIKTRLNNFGMNSVMTIPNVIRGPAIQVAGKGIQFRLEREFKTTDSNGSFRVIMIGKFVND